MAGDTVSALVGTAGATVSLPDGSLTLTFPAGAVSKETRIRIWPFVNTAPNAVGLEYAFEPTDLKLLKPVHVAVAVDPASLGPDQIADGLGLVQKNDAGEWEGNIVTAAPSAVSTRPTGPSANRDATYIEDELAALPRTTVATLWRVNPARASLATGATKELEILACFQVVNIDTRAVVRSDCGPSVRQGTWSVNGVDGGTDLFGKITTLSPSSRARYRAPFVPPPLNPVLVRAAMLWPERGLTKVFIIPITVTGGNDWTGTIEYNYSGDTTITVSGDLATGGTFTKTEFRAKSGQGRIEFGSYPGYMSAAGGTLHVRSYVSSGREETTVTEVRSGSSCTVKDERRELSQGSQAEVFSDPLKSLFANLVFEGDRYTLGLLGLPTFEIPGTYTITVTSQCQGQGETTTTTSAELVGETGLFEGFLISREFDVSDPGHLVGTAHLQSGWVNVTIQFDLRRR